MGAREDDVGILQGKPSVRVGGEGGRFIVESSIELWSGRRSE